MSLIDLLFGLFFPPTFKIFVFVVLIPFAFIVNFFGLEMISSLLMRSIISRVPVVSMMAVVFALSSIDIGMLFVLPVSVVSNTLLVSMIMIVSAISIFSIVFLFVFSMVSMTVLGLIIIEFILWLSIISGVVWFSWVMTFSKILFIWSLSSVIVSSLVIIILFEASRMARRITWTVSFILPQIIVSPVILFAAPGSRPRAWTWSRVRGARRRSGTRARSMLPIIVPFPFLRASVPISLAVLVIALGSPTLRLAPFFVSIRVLSSVRLFVPLGRVPPVASTPAMMSMWMVVPAWHYKL